MFFLFLILLFVFLANKDSVRQARLNRDLACLRRRKMEAVLAARRAQVRIDQIEAARAIPAAEAVVYGGFVPLKDMLPGSGARLIRSGGSASAERFPERSGSAAGGMCRRMLPI